MSQPHARPLRLPATLCGALLVGSLLLAGTARADLAEHLDYTWYPVPLQKGASLRDLLNAASPVHTDGRTYHAHTEWHVHWHYHYLPQPGGGCRIDSVHTTLTRDHYAARPCRSSHRGQLRVRHLPRCAEAPRTGPLRDRAQRRRGDRPGHPGTAFPGQLRRPCGHRRCIRQRGACQGAGHRGALRPRHRTRSHAGRRPQLIFSASPSAARPVPRWCLRRPCRWRAAAPLRSPRRPGRAGCSRRQAFRSHRRSSRGASVP